MPTLFLASASPRRAELLGQIGVPFQRVSASIDETPRVAEEPVAYVERLALEKAQAGLQRLEQAADAVVLGADTAVVLDGRILGKPQDRADALAMLAALSGREHEVLTAVALCSAARCASVVVASQVRLLRSVQRRPRLTGPVASRWTRPAVTPFRVWAPCLLPA